MMQSTANTNNRYHYHRNIQVTIIIFFVWYSIVTTFSSSSAWSSTKKTGVLAFTVSSSLTIPSRSPLQKVPCEQRLSSHSYLLSFPTKSQRGIQNRLKWTRTFGQSKDEQTSPPLPQNGINGEVVGATGRIGSFILQKGNGTLAAVPRGLSPGCLSPAGTPIYVAVPSTELPGIIKATAADRQSDLVLLSNFVPCDLIKRINIEDDSLIDKDWTTAVLHFGVLSVGGNVVSSDQSPPTMISGKHARALASLLEPDVQVKLFDGEDAPIEIEKAAARKLIWVSLMWLLCHEHDGEDESYPINVATVHEKKSNELRQLVEELLPAVDVLLGEQRDNIDETLEDEVLSYLEAYSLSMPNAVPNKHLAIDEVEGRNGVLLSVSEQVPQPLHKELIRKVAGSEVVKRCTSAPAKSEVKVEERGTELLHCEEIGLSFHCRGRKDVPSSKTSKSHDKEKSIVVIGAGIIGTSVALNLARRNVKVTVLDRRPIANGDIGEATSCTWAWINANSKKPLSYKLLNALGMAAWRRDGIVRDLPNWCGSLVRYKISDGDDNDPWCGGAYFAEGPLSKEQMKEIEPTAAFLSSDDNANGESGEVENVYHFPDEGQVDPTRAVREMRLAAEKLGVRFMGEVEVTDLLRDEEGGITGVVAKSTNTNDSVVLEANEIVVAGGEGSAEEALGGLPMMNHPGTLAFARLSSQDDATKEYHKEAELRRILVDTVTQSHVLCREDGTLVAGGGVLQVGGTSATDKPPIRNKGADSLAQSDELGKQLLKAASRVAPGALQHTSLVKTMEGRRPIPLDGYPAVGYLEPSLYVVVTHSGMTLSHVLGNIVAGEIAEGVSCDILEEYRPTRFNQK